MRFFLPLKWKTKNSKKVNLKGKDNDKKKKTSFNHLVILFEFALHHIYIYSSNNNFYEKPFLDEYLVKMFEFVLKNNY